MTHLLGRVSPLRCPSVVGFMGYFPLYVETLINTRKKEESKQRKLLQGSAYDPLPCLQTKPYWITFIPALRLKTPGSKQNKDYSLETQDYWRQKKYHPPVLSVTKAGQTLAMYSYLSFKWSENKNLKFSYSHEPHFKCKWSCVATGYHLGHHTQGVFSFLQNSKLDSIALERINSVKCFNSVTSMLGRVREGGILLVFYIW